MRPFSASLLVLAVSCALSCAKPSSRRGGLMPVTTRGDPTQPPNPMVQSGDPVDAVIGTAVGLTAAGVSRAQGGCYAACPTGTACNPKTGFCDELPCRGLCKANERCDLESPIPRCVEDKLPPLLLKESAPRDGPITPQ